MSQLHSGNVQPSIDREEHATASGIDAKKVFVFDNAGNQITSFSQTTITMQGLVTLAPSPNFIGLATITPGANVTLNSSAAYIGLATITPALSWPDPKAYIGLVTVGNTPNVAVVGNVTLSDSRGYIGLATITHGSNVTLNPSAAYIGLTTVSPALSWPDPKTYIGLVTVTPAANITLNSSAAFIGLVTIAGMSTVTLADPKGYIGLVTVTEAVPYSSPSVIIGMVSAASGALTQFASNTIKWVDIRASYANATTIYVGGSNATINNGFPLAPGDTIGMAISNTNQLYLVGVGTSECRFLGGS